MMTKQNDPDFRPIRIPPEDERFISTITGRFSIEEICRTFSIPAHLLAGEDPKGDDDAQNSW
jgi:hypothetical protein